MPLQVVVEEDGQGVEMIERNVEKALDLAGMQVDAQDPIDARRDHEVGAKLGGDGGAGRDFAVLPRVPVIGDHGRDRSRRRAAQRVGQDEQLHHVVVHRRTGGLDDVRIDTPHIFADLAERFPIAEARDADLAERHLENLRYLLSQRGIRVAREDADLLEHEVPPKM
jgi:hypothetical protein